MYVKCQDTIPHTPVYKHTLAWPTGRNEGIIIRFPSALPLTRPGKREEIFQHLFLQGHGGAATTGEFKTVNKEVMGFEPTVISRLAVAFTWDISK